MSDLGISLLVGGFVLVVYLLRHKKDITAKGPWFEFRARDGKDDASSEGTGPRA